MDTIPLDLNGATDLPPGKIANVATCLEMFSPPQGHAQVPIPRGHRLEPLSGADHARYRTLFRAVGEPWLWFSRLYFADAQLTALLGPVKRVAAFSGLSIPE